MSPLVPAIDKLPPGGVVLVDSWTGLHSHKHRPGAGADFTSGDMSEQQYRALGYWFDYDFASPDRMGFQPDEYLFDVFRKMATELFSSGELIANTNAMIDRFQSGGTGEYENQILTNAARQHASTKRFVERIAAGLKDALKACSGNAARLQTLDYIPSPTYATVTDKFVGGLTIAVNDTWAYEVRVTDYLLTGATSYRAKASIVIWDHFGLDTPDLTEHVLVRSLAGFRAWFILQHLRKYQPFVTRIAFEQTFTDSFS